MENTDTLNINIQQMKPSATENLGLNVEAEIGPITTDDAKGGGFGRSHAAEKLGTIDDALSHINGMRAELGAKQNRLGSTISNLTIAHENVSAATSRIRDVDYAAESAEFTQTKILQQAGAAALAQANNIPELALTLLR